MMVGPDEDFRGPNTANNFPSRFLRDARIWGAPPEDAPPLRRAFWPELRGGARPSDRDERKREA